MTRSAILMVLFLLIQPAMGQETYSLRFRPIGKGHESATEFQTRVRINLSRWDQTGLQIVDDLKVMKHHIAFNTTTLEATGNVRGKSRRHIGKSVMSIDGGDEVPDDLQGKSMILLEGEDG